MTLQDDVPGESEHTPKSFLHLDELFAFFVDWPAQADSATKLGIAAVES